MPRATERRVGALRGQFKVLDPLVEGNLADVATSLLVYLQSLFYLILYILKYFCRQHLDIAQVKYLLPDAWSKRHAEARTQTIQPIGHQEDGPGLSGPYTANIARGAI